jgi:hypothetical protein
MYTSNEHPGHPKNELYGLATLIKNKIKFSSYIRKFSWAIAKSYNRKGFLIYEEAQIFSQI